MKTAKINHLTQDQKKYWNICIGQEVMVGKEFPWTHGVDVEIFFNGRREIIDKSQLTF